MGEGEGGHWLAGCVVELYSPVVVWDVEGWRLWAWGNVSFKLSGRDWAGLNVVAAGLGASWSFIPLWYVVWDVEGWRLWAWGNVSFKLSGTPPLPFLALTHYTAPYRPVAGKRLPFLVALTADATEGVDARCALAGFHRVLTKPADVDALRGSLQAMAAYHDAAAGAGRASGAAAPHGPDTLVHAGGPHGTLPPALQAALAQRKQQQQQQSVWDGAEAQAAQAQLQAAPPP